MTYYRALTLEGVFLCGVVKDWRMREELERAVGKAGGTGRFPCLLGVVFSDTFQEYGL